MLSPYVGGAFGSGLRPRLPGRARRDGGAGAEALGARRADAPADVHARLPPGNDPAVALGATAAARSTRSCMRRSRITSQYEEFARDDASWSGALYKCANVEIRRSKLARLDLPTPSDMRAPGGATGMYALECAMDELAVELEPRSARAALALLFGSRSERGHSFTSKKLRECYRAGRGGFGWEKRSPRRARCATATSSSAVGMATGIWEAMQMKTARASRSPRTAMPKVAARRPISVPAPTRSWRRSRPTCSGCRSRTSR